MIEFVPRDSVATNIFLNFIATTLSDEWLDIAKHLGISEDVLDVMSANRFKSDRAKALEAMEIWRNTAIGKPRFEHLVYAFRQMRGHDGFVNSTCNFCDCCKRLVDKLTSNAKKQFL